MSNEFFYGQSVLHCILLNFMLLHYKKWQHDRSEEKKQEMDTFLKCENHF